MLTGLLANKLKVNITNIEHLYMKLAEYNDAVSKGFIEKSYVFGPINSSPQYIDRLWKLNKMTRKRSKKPTRFSETTSILNYQAIPGFTKHDKGGLKNISTELAAATHHEIPGFSKNEKNTSKRRKITPSEISNITIHSIHVKLEKGTDTKRNKTGRIKTVKSKTLTAPTKNKKSERKTANLMDIYVPIRRF